jgi:hypothetical protein
MEALSKLIENARSNGDLKGVKVVGQESVSHLLFFDDVLCFTNEMLTDVEALRGVMYLFYRAIGMVINIDKSCVFLNEIPNDVVH